MPLLRIIGILIGFGCAFLFGVRVGMGWSRRALPKSGSKSGSGKEREAKRRSSES
jgi:hypothetical protein